jgi:DNA-binding PadR family transcriptional regulator
MVSAAVISASGSLIEVRLSHVAAQTEDDMEAVSATTASTSTHLTLLFMEKSPLLVLWKFSTMKSDRNISFDNTAKNGQLYRHALYRTRTQMSKPTEKSLDAFLPLTPAVFHILLTLAEGESHGYAVMQEVAKRSAGSVRLGPGTLYGAISRLLDDGLIEETDERPDPELDDSRRRYYRLTKLGGRVLAAETERLSDLVKAARATKAVRKLNPA